MKYYLYPLLVTLCIFFPSLMYSQVRSPIGLDLQAIDRSQLNKSIMLKSNRFVTGIETNMRRQLRAIKKQEDRLRRKLIAKDSSLVRVLYGDSTMYYSLAPSAFQSKSDLYSSYVDSMRTALDFLDAKTIKDRAKQFSKGEGIPAILKLQLVQDRLNQSEALNSLIQERQRLLIDRLTEIGLIGELKGFVKQANLYKMKAEEYRRVLSDPSKIETKVLSILSEQKVFSDFFNRHSQLAGLFRMPGNSSVQEPSIPGLQTRLLVQQEVRERIGQGSDLSQITRSQVTPGSSGLPDVKARLNNLRKENNEVQTPVSKINPRRAKTFFQRLELGGNLQNTPSSNYFPTITDLGLSVSYRIHENGSVGIGGSGKIGWGKDFRHIAINAQGVSLRSFADYRIKGAFYAMLAYEMNYNTPVNELRHISSWSYWTPSGLLGISRIIPLSGKLMKSTKIMLLWDYLSYQNIPRTQAILFRMGYDFN